MKILIIGGPRKPRIPDRWRNPLFNTWYNMVARCHNEKSDRYYAYGARGIWVCLRWREDFWAFVEDMGERPEGHTIDRIHNEGPYAPYNCRWADAETQKSNKTGKLFNSMKLTIGDQTYSLYRWAKVLGIGYTTAKRRYKKWGTVIPPTGSGRWGKGT